MALRGRHKMPFWLSHSMLVTRSEFGSFNKLGNEEFVHLIIKFH